jgi:hypothetical protein
VQKVKDETNHCRDKHILVVFARNHLHVEKAVLCVNVGELVDYCAERLVFLRISAFLNP